MLYTDTIISFMVLFEFLSCWCTVYLKICQLLCNWASSNGIHYCNTKSLWRMWIILCIYISNGSKYCKSHLVCILAQNIYAFYRSRFLGRFEIRNLVTRLCLNRDLCDLNTSTWGFRINFVVSTDT